ncbi:MAG: ferritin-like domain-containing protein [Leptolyngbyaceae cyanobacterium]
MVIALNSAPRTDLAGPVPLKPTLGTTLARIRHLASCYVTESHLRDRLEDLPRQFHQPQVRPWSPLPWRQVHADQLCGIDRPTFCAVLQGTINTEAPIQGYTTASRQYLQDLYPAMAEFVGGQVDGNGQAVTVGLWEREEKRHTPALIKLYTLLQGTSPQVVPHSARPYGPSTDPASALYRHGLHRVATEYGATCLYLWMMAHSTGPLQAVLAELLIDEINHMTKFWGFGQWAYPDSGLPKISATLGRSFIQKLRSPKTQGSLLHTLRRMMAELAWDQWNSAQRVALIYSFDQVMRPLWRWHQTLTPAYLNALFGPPRSPTASFLKPLVDG